MTLKLRTYAVNLRLATVAFSAVAIAGLFSGCATNQPLSMEQGVYKFTVFHYNQPVPVNVWSYNTSRSDVPEGAALNIVSSMQHGDVDQWLANWSPSERPALTQPERIALQQQWQALKGGQVCVLNRIVADLNMVVELSITDKNQKTAKVQIPLTHVNGEWCLTNIDPGSQFLNWEGSNNKIVAACETKPLENFLSHYSVAQLSTPQTP